MTIFNPLHDGECGVCKDYRELAKFDDKDSIGECQCKSSEHNKHVIGYTHPVCRYFTP